MEEQLLLPDPNDNGAASAPKLTRAEEITAIAEYRAMTSVLLERMQFMRQAGITFNGARDEYEILGYDRVVTSKQYRDEYARGGLAKRIVECFPKATWRGGVELYEDEDPNKETAFEKDWKDLQNKHNVWSKFQSVDILSGLSTFAVLLIGAAGALDTPLPKGKPGQVLYLQPFFGGGGPGPNQTGGTQVSDAYADATIFKFETDIRNPRFGLPLSYQIKRTDISSPLLARPVHWSRIIHIAEGCLDNEVYGQPSLECVWNLLIDLRKVTGGGSEAFWLRANQGLQLDVDKDMTLSPDEKEALRTQAEEYQHQMRRMLRTRGVKVNPLGSDVANFSSPVDAIIKQIAGTKGIPLRILTGSEMGELASSQDADNWRTQVQDRRTSYAGPMMVRRLADRLIEYGYLTAPVQYEVGWPTEGDLDDLKKAELAVKLAQANKEFGAPLFTDDFIREKTYDLEPLSDEERQAAEDNKPAPLPISSPFGAKPGTPGASKPGDNLLAASDAELLHVLAEAIKTGNTTVIDRVLGLDRKAVLPVPVHMSDTIELIEGVTRGLCGKSDKIAFITLDKTSVTCANCLNILELNPNA